ncbi:hypothetical protein B0H13DRAFT_2436051 [Mycena leptocephala]|nr:hypothetical protein B0H13DRAFT_2436051 [Mycena leptocephala]
MLLPADMSEKFNQRALNIHRIDAATSADGRFNVLNSQLRSWLNGRLGDVQVVKLTEFYASPLVGKPPKTSSHVSHLPSTSKPLKASAGSHVEPKTTYTSRHSSSSVHHSTRPASNSHFGTKKSIATSIHSRSSVHHSPTATRSVHTSGHKTPSGTSTGTSIKPSNMSSTSHSQHLSSRKPSAVSSISCTHHIVASLTSVHFNTNPVAPSGARMETLIAAGSTTLIHRVKAHGHPMPLDNSVNTCCTERDTLLNEIFTKVDEVLVTL